VPSGPGPLPLRIGVLLCDHALAELGHLVGGDYDNLFDEFLLTAATASGIAVDLSFFDAVNGVLPERRDVCDAWVITGSQHDAYADNAWTNNLRIFIRNVIAAEARVVGICFGHQLIATALGGVVEPTDQWRLGPQRLALQATPWFRETTVHLHAMHRDIITVLPAGATVIGAGTTADVPAYLLGDNVFCVQDHPEFPASYVSALIEARADRIDSETSSAAQDIIRRQPTDGADIGRTIIGFLSDDRIH
jgi:GMP synthase-like glutamine amidotransferase